MPFEFSDEQRQLQEQVRALLAERAAPEALRKTISASTPWDESLWRALGELGVLGAKIPEAYGGVGLGAVEVAIVAQELGRAVAPVPFFSSICLASEALLLAGTPEQKKKWLPRLASGEIVGAFAWTEGATAPSAKLLTAEFKNGRLTGTKSPVADAAIAQICVVAVRSAGQPALALVELGQPGVTSTPLGGIDEMRRFSSLAFEGARAELMDGAPGEQALQKILDAAAIYEAFEQVGGAEAALLTARDHVLQRRVFGRPLGSYQAIKHTLANTYAKLELATCNALHAVQVLQDGGAGLSAAASAARVGATAVYETMARDNLQFHGGIGFTWEANCHFHYRRARMLALNIGSREFWCDRLVQALAEEEPSAPKTVAARANIATRADSQEESLYRQKVRAWIAEAAARTPRAGDDPKSIALREKAWTRAKYEAGYAAIAHPKEFGGAGGAKREQQIFAQEEARAGMAMPIGGSGFHQAMAAIGKHGAREQRRKWETLTYSGDIFWCQLFSEPAAGSDLAAVRTRAVKRGDKWIVNGQKVWTSGGHLADYGILLARTNPDVPKHQGLSFFIIDMRQPGVTVRPIRQINGQSDFTETFFTDAEIPDENRLGELGQGWAVAMTVLAHERNTTRSMSEGERRNSATSARNLIRLAKGAKRDTGVAFDSAAVRERIAHFHVEAQGIKNFALRLQEKLAAGGPPPLNLPVLKLTATNRVQQVQAFLMDLDEAGGIVGPAEEDRFIEYVTSASSRIAGGADEVLRNQLAERALGLPGDTRADKDLPFSALAD